VSKHTVSGPNGGEVRTLTLTLYDTKEPMPSPCLVYSPTVIISDEGLSLSSCGAGGQFGVGEQLDTLHVTHTRQQQKEKEKT
jgi:hypothetical protein